MEGLIEEENEDEEAAAAAAPDGEDGDVAGGAITLSAKKTERQRKREKAEKIKVFKDFYFASVLVSWFLQ